MRLWVIILYTCVFARLPYIFGAACAAIINFGSFGECIAKAARCGLCKLSMGSLAVSPLCVCVCVCGSVGLCMCVCAQARVCVQLYPRVVRRRRR